jgi:hypothetical protein
VENYRRLDPPRAVLVLHNDGVWYPGLQDAWSRWPDTSEWRASVSYSVAPGMKYVRSVPADQLKLP